MAVGYNLVLDDGGLYRTGYAIEDMGHEGGYLDQNGNFHHFYCADTVGSRVFLYWQDKCGGKAMLAANQPTGLVSLTMHLTNWNYASFSIVNGYGGTVWGPWTWDSYQRGKVSDYQKSELRFHNLQIGEAVYIEQHRGRI